MITGRHPMVSSRLAAAQHLSTSSKRSIATVLSISPLTTTGNQIYLSPPSVSGICYKSSSVSSNGPASTSSTVCHLSAGAPLIPNNRPSSNYNQRSNPIKATPHTMTGHVEEFLARNRKFAETADPKLLQKNAEGQSPSLFWLGCCDSRVPEGVVIGARPGEVFVHRNIANLFCGNDASATAALEYAVLALKVTDVVVVGHESCGGCAAALEAAKAAQASGGDLATVQKWIEPIKQLASAQLQADPNAGLSKLVATNVRTQVTNIVKHEVVQKAWAKGQALSIHGWVYDLASGKMNDLCVTQCKP